MKTHRKTLLISALAVLTACLGLVRIQTVTETHHHPRSHFFRSPRLSDFELVRDGWVLHQEKLPGPEKGAVLRAVLGEPLASVPWTVRTPFFQAGRIRVAAPVTFFVDGRSSGETTMLGPIGSDETALEIEMRGFSLVPPWHSVRNLEERLIAATVEGIRSRAGEANRQGALKTPGTGSR